MPSHVGGAWSGLELRGFGVRHSEMSSQAAIRPRFCLAAQDTCGSRFQGIRANDAGEWRRSSWALTSEDGFGCTHAGGVVDSRPGREAESGLLSARRRRMKRVGPFLSSFGLAARVGVLQRRTRVGSSAQSGGIERPNAELGGLRLVLGMRSHKTAYRNGFGWAAGKPWGGQMLSGKKSARCATRVKLNGCAQLRVGLQLSQWYEASEGAYGSGEQRTWGRYLEEREFTYGWPSLNPRCGQQLNLADWRMEQKHSKSGGGGHAGYTVYSHKTAVGKGHSQVLRPRYR